MGEIADVLRLAYEISSKSSERRQGLDEKSWDTLIIVFTSLHDLLRQHEAAIQSVVSPMLNDNDLGMTCRRYRELLDGVSVFSSEYEDAQGIIRGARHFKQFDEDHLDKSRIMLVSHRLGEFQHAAFFLQWHSSEPFHLLFEANSLREILSRGPSERASAKLMEQRERIRDSFLVHAFPSLRPKRFDDQPETLEIAPLETADDVTDLVRKWCRGWSDRISQLLYRGGECGICGDKYHNPSKHGLYRILGEMKAMRFES
jgi:hypothetical protein